MAGNNADEDGLGEDCKLMSMEKLEDRASPELWPEQIPGVTDFVAMEGLNNGGTGDSPASKPKWMKDLETDDINLIQELASLTPTQLLAKVRQLQNLAYQLGLEEAREMTRGKYLNILQRPRQGLGG